MKRYQACLDFPWFSPEADAPWHSCEHVYVEPSRCTLTTYMPVHLQVTCGSNHTLAVAQHDPDREENKKHRRFHDHCPFVGHMREQSHTGSRSARSRPGGDRGAAETEQGEDEALAAAAPAKGVRGRVHRPHDQPCAVPACSKRSYLPHAI